MKSFMVGLAMIMVALAVGMFVPLPAQLTTAPVTTVQTIAPVTTVQTIATASQACVLIEVESDMGFGWAGSGFVASEDGVVVTAGHVVEGGCRFTVTFEDGRVFTSTDAYRIPDMDCGVIKISTDGLSYLKIRTEPVSVGEAVIVFGHPFGRAYGLSVGTGVISGLDRRIPVFGSVGLIQTDLEVNGGNSGGPLLDFDGNVVGIVIGHRRSGNSLTFVTPAHICQLAIDAYWMQALIEGERYE